MPAETKLVAVATDGSAGAALAVEWAATFARSLDAELLAIQVIAPPAEPEAGERRGRERRRAGGHRGPQTWPTASTPG